MRKVLIATISEVTNADLSKALSRYEVHICSTGTEALAMIETIHPDVLIIDLMLPVIDGLTVLRKTRFRPHIILARTNLISASVLQSAANLEVQEVLLIPCTIHYILDRLDFLVKTISYAGDSILHN